MSKLFWVFVGVVALNTVVPVLVDVQVPGWLGRWTLISDRLSAYDLLDMSSHAGTYVTVLATTPIFTVYAFARMLRRLETLPRIRDAERWKAARSGAVYMVVFSAFLGLQLFGYPLDNHGEFYGATALALWPLTCFIAPFLGWIAAFLTLRALVTFGEIRRPRRGAKLEIA